MSYQVLAMDIDGTLRPFGSQTVPAAALAALQAVQRAGVRIVVATGRGRVSVPGGMLGRLRPDAWLCAAGPKCSAKTAACWPPTASRPKKCTPSSISLKITTTHCVSSFRTATMSMSATPKASPPQGPAQRRAPV